MSNRLELNFLTSSSGRVVGISEAQTGIRAALLTRIPDSIAASVQTLMKLATGVVAWQR